MKRQFNILVKSLWVGSVIFVSACSETPMEKLASGKMDYDLPNFWREQADKKTPLWDEAVEYCKENAHRPNCGSVITMWMFRNGSTTSPGIGKSGYELTIPEFK